MCHEPSSGEVLELHTQLDTGMDVVHAVGEEVLAKVVGRADVTTVLDGVGSVVDEIVDIDDDDVVVDFVLG